MKNTKTALVVGILVLAAMLPIMQAADHPQTISGPSNFTSYTYSSSTELIITFGLTDYHETLVTTEQGDFTLVEVGTGFLGDIGGPQLPAVTSTYAVPTQDVAVEILEAHLKETRSIDRIYPVQHPQSDDHPGEPEFAYDEAAYQQDSMVPDQLVELVDTGNIRDIPFATLRFCPVTYNPVQQVANIYDSVVVKLTFPAPAQVSVEQNFEHAPFYSFYSNVFQNWDGFVDHTMLQPRATTRDAGCDYLMITHENYYTQAKELADWKHASGLMAKTVNVSEAGSNYNQIRQYIQDAYDTWTPAPSYVLLFGDAEQVPTTYVYGTATDLWYACVDGSDYIPDLFIGRIPADNAGQADTIVQKILTYEQSPPTLASFYQNMVVAAYFQDDNNNHYEDRRFVRTSEEVKDYLFTLGYIPERIYVTSSSITPTHYNDGYYGNGEPLPPDLLRPGFAWDGDADDICNALDAGIFILNHRDHGMQSGWGDPYFTTSNFNEFSNGELLPVVFSINCLTGQFDTGECFCEEFLRKTDGGCVAIFGASDVSYSGYNDWLCRGFYDGMWPDFDINITNADPLYQLGQVLNYGKVYMTQTWGDPWGYERLTFEMFHVFGDPALDLYTAVPEDLEVTYVLLTDTIQVTVTSNSNPLEGARVCISQDSGFFQSGLTDATGIVELDKTTAATEDEVLLVATAHNHLYFSDSFMLNQRPEKPATPDGPTDGKVNTAYMYKTSTVDLDGDRVYYNFSWGDGTYSDWIGPYDSGEEATAKHSWKTKGNYDIKVKAKDTMGGESDWSDPLPVSMPLKISFSHPLLEWLYSRIVDRFPLLAALIEQMLL
ncbi:MAG: PKD domain-containing protein [Candidatus Thermoplasmatota archaeon]|nr:PKD domain-containing protein [Candidatus Thermoplasmatota archaeon]